MHGATIKIANKFEICVLAYFQLEYLKCVTPMVVDHAAPHHFCSNDRLWHSLLTYCMEQSAS